MKVKKKKIKLLFIFTVINELQVQNRLRHLALHLDSDDETPAKPTVEEEDKDDDNEEKPTRKSQKRPKVISGAM